MLNLDFKKELLPHFVAIMILLITTAVFFAPLIFEGKSLPQHDIIQWEGGAHESMDFRDKTGEEALWTNSMFGGMPTYLVNTQFSGELTKYMHIMYGFFLPSPANLVFIACLSCYIMLIIFGVRNLLAVAGAIAFGFTSFSIIGLSAGHNAKVAAVAMMPLILAGIHMTFSKKQLWGFILTTVGLAMHLRVNHFQVTYYLLLIVLFYGLMQLIQSYKEKKLPQLFKTVGLLVIAVLLALGSNFGRFWTIMEYSPYSIRGESALSSPDSKSTGLDKDYAFEFSNSIAEPVFLFIPNFYGGSSFQDLGKNSNLEQALRKNGLARRQINQQVKRAPSYWGDQRLSAPYYAGATVVFLFILSLYVLDRKYALWLCLTAAIGIVLSWGDNFSTINYLIFDYLPGYNKFRSVTFTIIITVFCLVLAGFLGLEKLLSAEWNKTLRRKFLMALGISGGFAISCIIFAGFGSYEGAVDVQLAGYPDWYLEALRADRASLLRMDALRALIFVLLLAGVIWTLVKQKLNQSLGYVLIILLVMIDMLGVEKRFINGDTFTRKSRKSEFIKTQADETILRDRALDFRVLNLFNPFNDAKTSYHHKSVGGYHGAKMGRYQDLIEQCISPEMTRVKLALQKGNLNYGKTEVINMLNTKYFIAGSSANAVIPNQYSNGNAWFVRDVKKVSTADEEIAMLKEIDTKNVAVINQVEFDGLKDQYSAASIIALVDYKPNYLKYEVTASDDGLAVFSEIYYPKGWTAKIDSVRVDILRANYILRALEIPKGNHIVEFEFKPKSYFTGNMVMWVANILIILILLGAIAQPFIVKSKG